MRIEDVQLNRRLGCSVFVARIREPMLWLPVLLASHSSLAAADNVAKASAPSEPQRHDLPADTTAKDAATKPPRDSASPDATMKRQLAYLQSEALVSEAVSAGRALSVCGACTTGFKIDGVLSCCDAA